MKSAVTVWIAVLLNLGAAWAGFGSTSPAAEAERLMSKGRELAQGGNRAGALVLFVRAAELFEHAGDDFGRARAFFNQGQIFWAEGRLEEAQDRFEKALPRFRSAGERLWVGKSLFILGQLAATSEKKVEARDRYREALPWLETGGNPAATATALVALGELELALEKPEDALGLLERALPFAQAAGNPDLEAAALRDMAAIHFLRADWELALLRARRALDLLEKAGDELGQAEALVMISESAENLGRPLESFSAREAEIRLRERLGDPGAWAQAHLRFGRFLELTGSPDEALRHYDKALELYKTAGNLQGEASVLYGVAAARWGLGEVGVARDRARLALAGFRSVGDRAGEGDAQRLLGLLARREEKRAEAISLLEQALQSYRDAGKAMQAAVTLSWLAPLYVLEGERARLEERVRWFSGFMESGLKPAERPLVLSSLALAYMVLEREAEARALYQETIALAREHKQPLSEAEALAGLGRSNELGGELEKALGLYQQSLAVREKLRAIARLDPLRQAIASSSFDVYERAVLVAFRLGRTAEAFELTERARARSLTDTLAYLALSPTRPGGDVLRRESALADPESASLVGAGIPATVRSLQELLDAETTLVSYFLTSESVLAFVLTRSSLSAVSLPVSVQELTRAAERLRSAGESLPETVRTVSLQLSPGLAAPLADLLRTPKVGVVPHGLLHYIPIAALIMQGRPLGERHTLFQLPSASSLLYLRRTPGEAAAPLLALAYSPPDDPLPDAAPEAEEIATAMGGQLLVGSEARVEALLARASGFRILHLAAHGTLDPQRPLFSRILLAPGKEDDGSLYLHQIYNLVLPRTDLVVLSACESGIGPESRGDEIAALGRGFFHAGVPTVVASLWKVGDASSRRLMVSFYRHLRRGMSKAEALQAAQAELRRSKDLAEPFHWAGFVLMGKPD
jgi:CHAT domain-containing protein